MTEARKKKPGRAGKYSRLVWGGFSDGVLHINWVDTGFGGFGESMIEAPALFLSRKRARQEYEDVRRIEIREV